LVSYPDRVDPKPGADLGGRQPVLPQHLRDRRVPAAAVVLASDEASFVNGIGLFVHGEGAQLPRHE
jgi:hypothetical protein